MIVSVDAEQLAAAVLAEGQRHPARSDGRRAAGHAWACLVTSTSITAARTAITSFGDEQTQRDATELLHRLAAGLAKDVPAQGGAATKENSMTSTTTTENTTAPVPAGWTWKLDAGEGQHWPLYVSPPDPDLEGRQDAIQVLLHTKSGGIRLSILQDLAGLETRDRVSEEFDGDYTSGGDVYFLDAEACAGLACWLLSTLTIDDKFLDGEGLGRWMPKIEGAALKLTEAHTDRLHAEIDKITGQLGIDGDAKHDGGS